MNSALKTVDLEARLAELEARIVELQQNQPPNLTAVQTPAAVAPLAAAAPSTRNQSSLDGLWENSFKDTAPAPRKTPRSSPKASYTYASSDIAPDTNAVSKVLGIGGGLCMLLACVYLVGLAIDSGWFTPVRQIAAAYGTGIILLFVGLFVMNSNKDYATYLCGAAIPILLLTTAAARMRYEVMGDGMTLTCVFLVCGVALWLDHVFQAEVFSFFAVAGAYLAPRVVPELGATPGGLFMYFGTCAIVFSAYTLYLSKRTIYLAALYLGLAAFSWHAKNFSSWGITVLFQVLQFVVFATTATLVSIRRGRAMNETEAWLHVPALGIFYFVVYLVLDRHAPAAMPFVLVGSAIIAFALKRLAASYVAVSGTIKGIIIAYTGIALIHGLYIESVPDPYRPWVGLVAGPAIMMVLKAMRDNRAVFGPLLLITALLFVFSNVNVLFADATSVPYLNLLRVIYATQLWMGFVILRSDSAMAALKEMTLYGGHVQAMGAMVAIFDNRLQVSLGWGVLAIATLLIALGIKSKEIGRSALLILAVAAGKGAFYDLNGSDPLMRVGCFAVLGLSLFGSGWLYNKLNA